MSVYLMGTELWLARAARLGPSCTVMIIQMFFLGMNINKTVPEEGKGETLKGALDVSPQCLEYGH